VKTSLALNPIDRSVDSCWVSVNLKVGTHQTLIDLQLTYTQSKKENRCKSTNCKQISTCLPSWISIML